MKRDLAGRDDDTPFRPHTHEQDVKPRCVADDRLGVGCRRGF
jgi:hypothetical protein